jgi:hypothetical protein
MRIRSPVRDLYSMDSVGSTFSLFSKFPRGIRQPRYATTDVGKQKQATFVAEASYTGKAVAVHTLMAYGGVEVHLHSFVRSALDKSNPIPAIKACGEVEV